LQFSLRRAALLEHLQENCKDRTSRPTRASPERLGPARYGGHGRRHPMPIAAGCPTGRAAHVLLLKCFDDCGALYGEVREGQPCGETSHGRSHGDRSRGAAERGQAGVRTSRFPKGHRPRRGRVIHGKGNQSRCSRLDEASRHAFRGSFVGSVSCLDVAPAGSGRRFHAGIFQPAWERAPEIQSIC